ncbi:hydrolase [Microvirga vignae]|uniref:Hydrolase n=1 Tax=Microvirga vignae TaxID=1225564 RepID=A0A0H1R535_9HYPH|nr:alpha/beta hydrolase [Microvirga vignae]KLK90204.1 hydrolase [Microvirga vignae]
MSSSYRDLFVSASDGLRLYARDYGPLAGSALPVVCLPGLARNSEDFHGLAETLSTDAAHPRRVLALDYRGRGRSEWASDWRQYELGTELDDVLQVLTVAGIEKAVFAGTSRGGLLTMALSATRPTLLAGAVLNDVGPVIEPKGLIRIRSYVGKLPMPNTLQEGAQILKQVLDAQFPAFTQEQWESMARGTWHEKNGHLALSYDPSLMKPLQELDPEIPMPDLWNLFGGMTPFPVLAIRGENSDLLSAQTLSAMQERHSQLTAITVPGQGHAPLIEEPIIQSIKDLIARAETSL